MTAFKDSKTALVADVDCTAGGKSLCNDNGIRGYPTIKYGDPNNLEDYKGGRDYSSLKEFADKNLGPTCGPNNLDLCSEETKATIQKLQAMPAADLEKEIAEKESTLEKLETDFKAFVEGLNKAYQEETKKKDEAIAEIKSSGLGLMKAVKAAGSAGGKSEL
mmetsp:Transcript_54487/g.123126  ORF Transcript_54487/g.123126 Transcript_54487/m.123126 type:complete len:162 (-) Transcript_54487:7-492(-)